MQVPSTYLNPLMSWSMLWGYQLSQSFRGFGMGCHLPSPVLSPSWYTAEPLGSQQKDKVGPRILGSDF